MPYTLKQAAEATGKSKPTILRAIQSHKISATKDEVSGSWLVEPAELHRVYPVMVREPLQNTEMTRRVTQNVMDETGEIRELRVKLEAATERLTDKDAVIDDLRRRLDASDEERRKAQAQLTTLLTDQRTQEPQRRSWWRFGKR